MGISSDAILFYGVCWGDEDIDFNFDLDNGVCRAGMHCCDEAPIPYVCIEKSEKRAWRGTAVPIDTLAERVRWDRDITSFCKEHGIDITDKRIGWWLVSWLG